MISVIIPVYNTEEKLLARCIQSILEQVYNDYEIVVIDDGSDKRCIEFLDKIQTWDDRIRVFHKENGGVSSARNIGMELAKGEYVCFVDADDTIMPEYLQSVVQCFSEHEEVDLVVGKVNIIESGGVYDWSSDVTEDRKLDITTETDKLEAVRCALFIGQKYSGVRGEVWCKGFRRRVVDGVRFLENVKIGEDQIFIAECLLRCRCIFVKNEYWYNYHINENSAMRKNEFTKDEQFVIFFKELENRLKNKITDKMLSEKAYRLVQEIYGAYDINMNSDKEKIYRVFCSCRRYKKDPLVHFYLKKLPIKSRTVGIKRGICNKLGISYIELKLIKMWMKALKKEIL